MTRRVTDGLIILAVLALGASHLWAQGVGGRRVVRPNQPPAVSGGGMPGAPGANGAPAMGAGAQGFAPGGPGNAPGGGPQVRRGSGGANGPTTNGGQVRGARR